MIDLVAHREGECEECSAIGQGVEFRREVGNEAFLCFNCFESMLEQEEEDIEDIASEDEAKKWITQEAERLGVSVEELLHPQEVRKHRARSVILRKALNYFRDNTLES